MRTLALALATAAAVAGTTSLASAQAYYPAQYGPRYVNPDYQPYGPGYYVGPATPYPSRAAVMRAGNRFGSMASLFGGLS